MGTWEVSRRSWGRKTIIRIYFIKIFFNEKRIKSRCEMEER